jgi:import inner membrane translocase subunit TIM17
MGEREPCPWRVVDDAGGAFVFGFVGGTVYHAIGGARNAPRGHMISQSIARVKARVPILGGSFAIWGTLFSCFDCTFVSLRKKEDPWNAIASGFMTGGVLAARAGAKAAAKNAAIGGVILAAIEGLNITVSRMLMPMIERKQNEASGVVMDSLDPPEDPLRPYRPPMRQLMGAGLGGDGMMGLSGGADLGPGEFDFATGKYKNQKDE